MALACARAGDASAQTAKGWAWYIGRAAVNLQLALRAPSVSNDFLVRLAVVDEAAGSSDQCADACAFAAAGQRSDACACERASAHDGRRFLVTTPFDVIAVRPMVGRHRDVADFRRRTRRRRTRQSNRARNQQRTQRGCGDEM